MHFVDHPHVVPSIKSGRYIDSLADLVRRHRIDLLIPLLDVELIDIAAAADRFAKLGCRAVISSERVVRICRDKIATHAALTAAKIDTPDTWTWDKVLKRKRYRFPYFLKPRHGSAAKGNYVVRNADELRTFGRHVERPIVQEFIEGVEHTLDVYTGFDGRVRCIVPRKRLEVRSGEVTKAVTVNDPRVIAVGRRVAEALAECRGVVTVQCMVQPNGRIRVIEINPRLGGGAPLSIHAGADFPRWIMMEHLGRTPRIKPPGFRADVAMLRYDDSVLVTNATKRLGLISK